VLKHIVMKTLSTVLISALIVNR